MKKIIIPVCGLLSAHDNMREFVLTDTIQDRAYNLLVRARLRLTVRLLLARLDAFFWRYRLAAYQGRKPRKIDFWGTEDLLYEEHYLYRPPEPDEHSRRRKRCLAYWWRVFRYGYWAGDIYIMVNKREEVVLKLRCPERRLESQTKVLYFSADPKGFKELMKSLKQTFI